MTTQTRSVRLCSSIKSVIGGTLMLLLTACASEPRLPSQGLPHEIRLQNVRQLTHGGQNTKAHWSSDGKWLSFQKSGAGIPCDQIFSMRSKDGSDVSRISNGLGRTTDAFYLNGNVRVIFSSTQIGNPACPAEPERSREVAWLINPEYRLFTARPDGTDFLPADPSASRAYAAETTVCQDGSVVFTSRRDGDPELYFAKVDRFGTLNGVTRITTALGYDGGAFFSPDCSKIVWYASRPKSGAEETEYRALLKQNLFKPSQLELWIADRNGKQARQLTSLNGVSWAPSFLPDGESVIFSSNFENPHVQKFSLYTIQLDGTRLERITFSDSSESFAQFSPDGKQVAFSSSRNGQAPGETNVFVAEWRGSINPKLENENRVSAPADRIMTDVDAVTPDRLRAEAYVQKRFQEWGLGILPGLTSYRHSLPMKLKSGADVSQDHLIGTLGQDCALKNIRPLVVVARVDRSATLLEVARIIGKQTQLKRDCFIFAAYTDAAVGTDGSSRFAEWAHARGLKFKAMLYLESVGRLRDNRLLTSGTDSAKEWGALLKSECAQAGLECVDGGSEHGPSGSMPVELLGTPVLIFFTDSHSDDRSAIDKTDVNGTGIVQVAQLVARVALKAASPSMKLHFRKISARPATVPVIQGAGAKFLQPSADLGAIVDHAALDSRQRPDGGSAKGGGVPMAAARPGSPADRAGIREGDILISLTEFDESGTEVRAIGTLQEFTQVMRRLVPGQRVILKIRRAGKEIELEAKVGARDLTLPGGGHP